MTEENQKKLYDHYLRTNQMGRVNEVLDVYPQFAERVETKSKEKK